MGQVIFHPSLEGAQHGSKGLEGFLELAKRAGAAGAQPSNFMLEGKTAKEINDAFEQRELTLDGISMHCPFWVHGTAWTMSPTIRPFLPADVANLSVEKIEQWTEDYLFRMMDLAAELRMLIVPMFWGVLFGWEMATGYPWGFFAGADYDLLQEGKDRFVDKTKRLRDHANSLDLILAHEIHPGTSAFCADDFKMLVEICDNDPCLGVNVDPSHCWEGEDWETRFTKVAEYCYGCHVKNHYVVPGLPLRSMEPKWQDRGMQFTDLSTGDINLVRFAELMIKIGYPAKYCEVMGTSTAPLVVEAESAYRDGDATSIDGVQYVRDHLCFPIAEGSFEDEMGAEK